MEESDQPYQTGQTAMNREPVRKIRDNSFFLGLTSYPLEESLLLNSLYIHLFIFFPQLSNHIDFQSL